MIRGNAKQITRATRALETYEQSAFPGEPSLLQHDPLYAEALLTALLCDLEHYANHHGINFTSAISTGHSINTEEATDQTTYEVGDQVRLTRQSGRCGSIIGWTSPAPDVQPDYLVEVPGVPFVYAETAAHLTPAPPFPPTETSLGTITHANQAEQAYTSITAQLLSTAEPTHEILDQDRHRLLDALSSWSGISTTQLHEALTPPPRATATSCWPTTTNRSRVAPQEDTGNRARRFPPS
ncbi:hypothetical protein [Actinomadura sp. 7K507]|uniref:hypothetical protein n=1 Tax=Actinomadura sp. 7K507 TaxID=2530365 RepID=UPI001053D11E|nr:hypothetical protein [Actinomadura sp. 7K507]TDC73850.1 hypothetical protein E1285_44175 [Actinomadura sp. 7K507]